MLIILGLHDTFNVLNITDSTSAFSGHTFYWWSANRRSAFFARDYSEATPHRQDRLGPLHNCCALGET